MKLLITESPSKAVTIQKFVDKAFKDDKFEVISSKGHIYQLQKKGKLNLGIDLNTFEPQWEIEPKHKKIVTQIVALAQKADVIYFATDADREGETIAYNLHNAISSKLKNKKIIFFRIVFNEITPDAIIHAIKNPTVFSQPMINSQLTRRMLDRIIGFRLSRLLSVKINSRSAGRVQSIVLKMIVERFKENQNFNKEKFWTLSLLLEHDFEVFLIGDKNNKYKNFTNKEIFLETKKQLNNSANLFDVKVTNKIKNPPKPFITATILKAGIANFGYSIQKINFILQSLYEGVKIEENNVGLISYPRTDSQRINEDFQIKILNKIKNDFGQDYLNNVSFTDTKKALNIQDAHEAIRITNLEYSPNTIKQFLTPEQFNVYQLIYNNCLMMYMTQSKYKVYDFIFENNNFLFSKKIEMNQFLGFEIISKKTKIEEQKTLNQKLITHFVKGENYQVLNVNWKEEETSPPPLLTESSIIDKLEKLGIGRPSTYNDAIFKTKQSNYIAKQQGKLIPSYRGILTDENIEKYFSQFINYKFSSNLEETLDKISQEKLDYKQFLEKFFKDFEDQIQACFKKMDYINSISLNIPCPSCDTGKLVIRNSKFGDFIACSNYPECKYTATNRKLLFPLPIEKEDLTPKKFSKKSSD
ncbi:type I DNA topoisomerase [Mycoplasma sp. SG1]|uniref:type I DNA topoisomerase n=1 Tax=Mycoplasma sp. SG1 TaxID=2810348 RepID=UPI0020243EB3|nr:type I DNA topoisomerase [Mycoplasma sp. SG1]URM52775.1 type I DNA topoisomerase [Mycoplasma sp. SG1]